MKPQFLDWNKPLLHLAAKYFVKEFCKDGRLWMKNIVVALPTSPAKERLEELLAIEAEKMQRHDWYPPRFITFGQLPEEFYTRGKTIADEMTQSFTWINVIENAEEHQREFLPVLPERNDVEARFRLGMMFAKLHYDLASEGKNCQDVAKLCTKISSEHLRWTALAELEKKYLDELDKKGFWDIQSARQNAVEPRTELREKVLKERQKYIEQFRKDGKQIYLAGVTDMNKAQKEILQIFSEFVRPLVFAPKELKDRFDDFGCLLPEKWVDADIDIDDSQIAVVLDDHEQADAVMRSLNELKGNTGGDVIVEAHGDVIVGVPDTKLIPLLEDRFERADIETKYVKRKMIKKTGVYRLLEILPKLLENQNGELPYREFAELLRHPEIYFKVKVEDTAGEILTLLDEYHGTHLPETVSKDWRKNMLAKDNVESQEKEAENVEHLTRVFENVQNLLTLNEKDNESHRVRLNLILENLYKKEKDDKEQSQDLKRTLRIIREAADKVDNVCAKTLLGNVPFANYIRLVLLQLSGEFISPYETNDAVDFVGWLDIPMSDTKVVIITGMNDGTVPSYVVSDQFLPDHLRTKLNILNNEQRIARDAYNLSVILRTRPAKNVKLIASRTATPSRLFFADKDEKVCERVKEFFKEKKEVKRQPEIYFKNESKIEKRTNSAFKLPKAEPIVKPKTSMSVTEFKTYKQCPYRFYLGKILWLKHLSDSDNELAANSFGSLIHKALEVFGKNETKRDADDPEIILKTTEKAFDELVSAQFGDSAKAAVPFQIELAKKRLEYFAQEQAKRRKEGWKIIDTEKSFSKDDGIEICDGMLLTGKIDRIDKRVKEGIVEYAVLDYKSGDTAKKPEKEHLDSTGWIDFQLPLYHYLLTESGKYKGKISLGYFTLPKDNKGGVMLVGWSDGEMRDAVIECKDFAKAILEGQKNVNGSFKISDKPPFYDDFPEICLTPQVKRKR